MASYTLHVQALSQAASSVLRNYWSCCRVCQPRRKFDFECISHCRILLYHACPPPYLFGMACLQASWNLWSPQWLWFFIYSAGSLWFVAWTRCKLAWLASLQQQVVFYSFFFVFARIPKLQLSALLHQLLQGKLWSKMAWRHFWYHWWKLDWNLLANLTSPKFPSLPCQNITS